MKKIDLLFVVGPTATGKTAVAVNIAEKLNGEIISADSMQIYKYMDIGTAKPTEDEKRNVPHHLIDELLPNEEYSAAVFQKKAMEHISSIKLRGKLPIIVGGTGFYANALLKGVQFGDENINHAYRKQMADFVQNCGSDALYEELRKIDPAYADCIHKNNTKRIMRALEFFHSTGQLFSNYNLAEKSRKPTFFAEMIILNLPNRVDLYAKINERVDKMIENGLAEEVEKLLKMGYSPELPSMQGIGYKEMVKFLNNEVSFSHAIDEIKQNTRHFAKRQLTWFRHQTVDFSTLWLNVDNFFDLNFVSNYIIKNIRE